jgi:hypothetical protein
VSRVLDQYLVRVEVDIVKNPGGEALYQKYGTQRGVPAWTILNAQGKVLADSGDGRENVGFPYQPEEVARYVKALQKACPKLTEAEVELLKKKLKEAGPHKEG